MMTPEQRQDLIYYRTLSARDPKKFYGMTSAERKEFLAQLAYLESLAELEWLERQKTDADKERTELVLAMNVALDHLLSRCWTLAQGNGIRYVDWCEWREVLEARHVRARAIEFIARKAE